ncbi:MAG: FAD-dependent oxidoreductase [Acidobacteriota bacterium]|nr:FAD-dependent oxidoreductase [Acidobacteriota bacterium]
MRPPDICIAGAGIIGLSLALNLYSRGYRVTVLEQATPLGEASTAAAGMLAAADPENPSELRALADLSLSLYPSFLESLHELSGLQVPFQTHTTLQTIPANSVAPADVLTPEDLSHLLPTIHSGEHRFLLLKEDSLDPRQLAEALRAAVKATSIDLRPNTRVLSTVDRGEALEIRSTRGSIAAAKFIDCTGAWSASTSPLSSLRITPKKGQMLYLVLPLELPLRLVVRTHEIYIVPRTTGPNAGRAVVGATVEDAGFDKTLHASDLAHLRSLASSLLPPLANAAQLDAWAGLRPATADSLPIFGALPGRPNHLLATGHFRNGILLAPATAHVMAQWIAGELPSIDLTHFSPDRLMAGRA